MGDFSRIEEALLCWEAVQWILQLAARCEESRGCTCTSRILEGDYVQVSREPEQDKILTVYLTFFAVSEACFLYLSPSCLLLKSCLMGEKSSSVEFATVIFFAASDFVHIVQLYADINVCFSLWPPFLTKKLFSLQHFIALCSLISKADYLITSIDSLGCFSPCGSMPESLPQFWLRIGCHRQYSLNLGNFYFKLLQINANFWSLILGIEKKENMKH